MTAPHDVFICYSSEDKTIADGACERLEASGIECWMAPRDPLPGIPYAPQIVEAIETTKILLLIFSSKANASHHVLSEIELAHKRDKMIVPFRIEGVLPEKGLEYYIQPIHWLDALTPPFENRLDDLVDYVTRELAKLNGGSVAQPGAAPASDTTDGPLTPAVPPPPVEGLTWRTILLWYVAAIALGTLGTYLAYGPLTSDSWARWATSTGTNVVFLDVSRLLIAALLALFAIHNLDVVPNLASARRRINDVRLERYERVIVGAAVMLLAFTAYYVLPKNFEHVYAGQIAAHEVIPGVTDPLSYRQIFGPYFPYSLYVIGLWLGIVFPVLFFLIRSIRCDWDALKTARGALDVVVPDNRITRSAVARYVLAANEVFALLKEIAGRYIPIFLAIITVTLIEELTPLKNSVLEPSADFGKVMLWLLSLPTFVISIALFSVIYDSEVKHAKNALSALIRRLKDMPAKTKEYQDATKALRDISDRETSVKALVDVLKMGSVGVYALVVMISALTISVLRYHENWARAFVPQWVIDWLAHAVGIGKR